MAAANKHKEAIIVAAVRLFRKQGYASTGLLEILAESGAPRGSLYYHFPEGKAGIGVAAIQAAGTTLLTTLRELATEAKNPADLVARYFDMVAGWMEQSSFRDGSPFTTIVLETVPQNAQHREAADTVMTSWAEFLAGELRAAGVSGQKAGRLGYFTLAALEGALIQSRVKRDKAPILQAAQYVRLLYAEAMETGAQPRQGADKRKPASRRASAPTQS